MCVRARLCFLLALRVQDCASCWQLGNIFVGRVMIDNLGMGEEVRSSVVFLYGHYGIENS